MLPVIYAFPDPSRATPEADSPVLSDPFNVDIQPVRPCPTQSYRSAERPLRRAQVHHGLDRSKCPMRVVPQIRRRNVRRHDLSAARRGVGILNTKTLQSLRGTRVREIPRRAVG